MQIQAMAEGRWRALLARAWYRAAMAARGSSSGASGADRVVPSTTAAKARTMSATAFSLQSCAPAQAHTAGRVF